MIFLTFSTLKFVATYHRGNVRNLLVRSVLFLLMGVEHGTASKWCELLGIVGTHVADLRLLLSLKDEMKNGTNLVKCRYFQIPSFYPFSWVQNTVSSSKMFKIFIYY